MATRQLVKYLTSPGIDLPDPLWARMAFWERRNKNKVLCWKLNSVLINKKFKKTAIIFEIYVQKLNLSASVQIKCIFIFTIPSRTPYVQRTCFSLTANASNKIKSTKRANTRIYLKFNLCSVSTVESIQNTNALHTICGHRCTLVVIHKSITSARICVGALYSILHILGTSSLGVECVY